MPALAKLAGLSVPAPRTKNYVRLAWLGILLCRWPSFLWESWLAYSASASTL